MRPCIRNLDCFRKKGCPEKSWNGVEGCPAWKEYSQVIEAGQPPRILKDCIDIFSEIWLKEALGISEQVVTSVQSFRNGMVEKGADGNTYPKADIGTLSLVAAIKHRQMQLELSFKDKDQIEG